MSTVSVIVATYRRDVVCQRALESLAAQTYSDFEIILVDDNDHPEWNDKIKKIVDDFREKFPAISLNYIQNRSNLGSARTRNVGIEAATGEYICFLDDDDIYYPGKIENQLIPMKAAGADYSITNIALYSEAEKLIEERTREYIKETTTERLLQYHFKYHMTGTDTMMFRRDYIIEIGGFPHIDVGDEFYLMHRAIEKGGRFLHVPVCDVKAYIHTGEGGLSSGKQKIDGENDLYEYKQRYFKDLDKKSIRYIKMRHYAVLAYAYLRMKQYKDFLINGTKAFFISPIEAATLLFIERG